MQAAYFTPAVPVPTVIDMFPPNPMPAGGKPELPFALAPSPFDVVVPRLATAGDFELPHPEARSERVASNAQRVCEDIDAKRSTPA